MLDSQNYKNRKIQGLGTYHLGTYRGRILDSLGTHFTPAVPVVFRLEIQDKITT